MSTFCIPFISSSLPVRFLFMIFICFCSLEGVACIREGGGTRRQGRGGEEEEGKKRRGRREDEETRKEEKIDNRCSGERAEESREGRGEEWRRGVITQGNPPAQLTLGKGP